MSSIQKRHVLGLLEVQAGGGLVEQQQLRLDAQRAAELDHLAHAVGQVGDQLVAVALQVEEVDHLLHLVAVGDFGPPRRRQEQRPATASRCGHAQCRPISRLLQHAGIGEQLDVLEGPRDAAAGDLVRRHPADVLVLEYQAAERRRRRCG